MVYAVNVSNWRGPSDPIAQHGWGFEFSGSYNNYRGHRSGRFCNRQVAIVADSPEEALEKAQQITLKIAGKPAVTTKKEMADQEEKVS